MNELKRKEREEEFKNKASIVHKGKYVYDNVYFVNKTTKVDILCPIHGIFSQTPKNHLGGQGCPECGKIYAMEWRKGNYENFNGKLKERFGDEFETPFIEKEYENEKSKVTIVCKRCGQVYNVEAAYILSPRFNGCTECRYKYSFDDLIKKNKTANEIVKFEGYKDSRKDTVTMVCTEHGEYETRVSTLLDGRGECRKCNGYKKLMKENDFNEKLRKNFGSKIKPISPFNGTMRPMEFVCENNHRFIKTPNTLFFNNTIHPCPICAKMLNIEQKTKSTEQFIKDAIEVYGEGVYDFSETVYEKSNKPVTIKCNQCGRYFTIEANSFLQGHGCPYHNCNSSIMEKELGEVIKENGYEYFTNDRTILNGKELDIYIPSKKIAFEFDGIYWHNELNKNKSYHLDKTIECEKIGIRLIHIFEDEWINKKDILLSMIKNILGNTEMHIYARKCKVVKIDDASVVNDFLMENHLQGICPSTIKYGLYYNNELVSLMTFGKSRHFIGNGSREYELLRFCNKKNYNVIGAASKLFKSFIKEYNPSSVVSYADRRWSIGNLYEKLGFTLYNKSNPNYYYVIGNERKNRFNYRKSELMRKYNCPKDVSEHEFCLSQKWYRIYDCGCLCYEWNK